jgi:uncharacterized protein YabN with tetrapyrrole methylase and pyrophosphatase domain
MPLLVVPLAAEHIGALTLDEFDRLVSCKKVLFEDPSHPLLERLRDIGVEAGAFDDEPDGTSMAGAWLPILARLASSTSRARGPR